jgi:MATE family multidrug resistance protein
MRAGGSQELLKLAGPLILSNAFWTIQLTIDRVMLSRQNSDAVGAAMTAAVFFWTGLILLQQTAGYSATFVAQYVGAGRPERVGPAVWQALHFSLIAGLGFLLLIPFADVLVDLGGHAAHVKVLEAVYLKVLCFATLPVMVIAAVNGFFAGRGDSWPVMIVNIVGAAVNAVLCYAWIYGHWGFAEMGIAGAGWATVAASYASAAVALALMLKRQFREKFATLSGWRLDPELFRRMMRFGIPSGMQYCMEALAFSVFLVLIGQIGETQLAATSIVFTINMIALVPMVGLAQAVSVLVGQRLGENSPEIAARSAVRGVAWCLLYTAGCAVLFLAAPGPLADCFQDADPARWLAVSPLIPVLLRFVVVYCLFESISLILSAALRGAGDTRFVSLVTLVMAWSVMVLPTIAARYAASGLYAPWAFATAYIVLLSFIFIARFRQGKWRQMRVIESLPAVEQAALPSAEPVAAD